jgi:hypothetical protein
MLELGSSNGNGEKFGFKTCHGDVVS